MAYLQISELSKSFTRQSQALKNFSLSLDKGQFLVLLGPSGCGKSTLLRLIAGLETPDTGSIHVDGVPWNSLSIQSRNVAMTFQNYALFPHLSLLDNMCFGIRVRGTSRKQAYSEAQYIAEKLSISHLLHRKPHEVSGGERQRCALGRSILRKPSLYLLDEPLSSLDAQLRYQLRREIKSLQQELGATMIFVTHDQEEALALGDQIAVMQNGQLMQTDSPWRIYHQASHTFVASFLGRPGTQFFNLEELLPSLTLNPNLSPLPKVFSKALSPSGALGSSLLLGIRPEHFILLTPPLSYPSTLQSPHFFSPDTSLSPATPSALDPNSITLTASLTGLENKGSAYLLECITGKLPFIASCPISLFPSSPPEIGTRVQFSIYIDHLNYFDKATGARVHL